ncbi:MAG: high frequency lysogenization protein HflD [Wenzhouxiangellaceae bacterium]
MDQRSSDLNDLCLALAGLFEATVLVNDIARRGYADQAGVNMCLASVLNLNPDDISEIYSRAGDLHHGLRYLISVLNGRAEFSEPLRMAVTVLQLERRFRGLKRQQQALGRELDLLAGAEEAADNPAAPEVVAQLADAWVQHVGSIQPRIMVNGNPLYLKSGDNQSLIRALLLSALRAATLWRQLGGGRWRLMWQRKAYLRTAQALLNA